MLGGLVPLVLLGTAKLRASPKALSWGALLACGGVVFNRANVVAFAMALPGAMPQLHAQSYVPSAFEWGVSVGLVAATIFLFGWAARNLPVLAKEEPKREALSSAGQATGA